jgi:hypothetical protein
VPGSARDALVFGDDPRINDEEETEEEGALEIARIIFVLRRLRITAALLEVLSRPNKFLV